MANELTHTVNLRLAKGNFSRTIQASNTVDQTGVGAFHDTRLITTSEVSVTAFGDVSTEGTVFIRNLDATNYVQVGFATTDYAMRLAAGRWASFPAEPGIELFLKANTASCYVEIFVSEV
jgi:hypothetical protein